MIKLVIWTLEQKLLYYGFFIKKHKGQISGELLYQIVLVPQGLLLTSKNHLIVLFKTCSDQDSF